MASKSRTEAVRVVVRLRPRNLKEKKARNPRVTHVQDDDEHVHIEDETKGKAQSFHANQAFDAIEGFPVCCFAYGQTGSGKTHTIIGEESFITRKNYSGSDVDGLIPRAGKYLFERAAAMKDRTFRIRASFLEIYNEQVYDLLNFNTKQPKVLQVRHSPKVGFFVDDLSEVTIDSPQDLYVVLGVGIRNRRIASHNLNLRSSRGHCMLTVHIDSLPAGMEDQHRPNTASNRGASTDETGLATYGRFTFVDLAGSERLGESESKGKTAHETGHINKSLFNLGKVIAVLAKGQGQVRERGAFGSMRLKSFRRSPSKSTMAARRKYGLSGRKLPMKRTGSSSQLGSNTTTVRGAGGGVVSYRDSKLTMLLRDSLGGKSLALMIACCTPTKSAAHETHRTLQFAMGVKRIKNKAVVLLSPQEKLIANLRSEIKRLQEENERLRAGGAGLGILDIIASQGVSVDDLLAKAAANGNPEAAALAHTYASTSRMSYSPVETLDAGSPHALRLRATAHSATPGAGSGAGAGGGATPTPPLHGQSGTRPRPREDIARALPGIEPSSTSPEHELVQANSMYAAKRAKGMQPAVSTGASPINTNQQWLRDANAGGPHVAGGAQGVAGGTPKGDGGDDDGDDGGDNDGDGNGAPSLEDFLSGAAAPKVPGPVELSAAELTALQEREAKLDRNIAILRERMFPAAAFDSDSNRANLRRDVAARGFTVKRSKRGRGRARKRRPVRRSRQQSGRNRRTTPGSRGLSPSPMGGTSGGGLPPLPASTSPTHAYASHHGPQSAPPGMPAQQSFPELGIGGSASGYSPQSRAQQLSLLKKSLSTSSAGRKSRRGRSRDTRKARRGMYERHQEFTSTARILMQDVQQRRDGNFMF